MMSFAYSLTYLFYRSEVESEGEGAYAEGGGGAATGGEVEVAAVAPLSTAACLGDASEALVGKDTEKSEHTVVSSVKHHT